MMTRHDEHPPHDADPSPFQATGRRRLGRVPALLIFGGVLVVAFLGVRLAGRRAEPPVAARNQADTAAPAGDGDEFFEEKDAETVATIKDLIETRVRPAVANDGGDITFRGFKDGIVYLNMKGSCAGCPSSTATLQHGIQNLLKHFVPDVVEVRPI